MHPYKIAAVMISCIIASTIIFSLIKFSLIADPLTADIIGQGPIGHKGSRPVGRLVVGCYAGSAFVTSV